MRKTIYILSLYIMLLLTLDCREILPSGDYMPSKMRNIKQTEKFIFIVDEGEGCFYKVNKDNFDDIKKFGNKGLGPGEFSVANYIYATEKFVYVYDQGKMSIEVFSVDGDFVKNIKIQSFGYVVDSNDNFVYSVPSYKTNFKKLVDVYDMEGNYVQSLIESEEEFKTQDDFFSRIVSIDIDDEMLCCTFNFLKYEIITYDLNKKKSRRIHYPGKVKIEKPDKKNMSKASGMFIVNSDISIDKDKIYVLSILDDIYAAKRVDIFDRKSGSFIESYKLRPENLVDDEIMDENCFVYFDVDGINKNFYFVDLVYNASVKEIPESELKEFRY